MSPWRGSPGRGERMAEPVNEEVEGFVTLHVPARFTYIRTIRHAVTDLCARCGMSEFSAAQFEMAIDEACSNIIEHAYGGEAPASAAASHPGLRVNLIQRPDRVVAEIFDKGRQFALEEVQHLTPSEYQEAGKRRGLGLYIIRTFVDDLDYRSCPENGNCMRLTKLR